MKYFGSIRTLVNAERLLDWLKQHSLSEKDLAEKLSYDPIYLKQVLHQKEEVSLEFMKKICNLTKLDLKDVVITEKKHFFLGDQIKQLRTERKLSQEELGKAIGVSKQAISSYETGARDPNPEQRHKLVEFFCITEAELFGAPATKQTIPIHKAPLVSWVHANKFDDINDPFPPGVSDEYIYTSIQGEHIFALRVQNDCMEPEFREGDLIIIKPNVHVTSGDFVIVADRDENKATFKQFKEYGTKKILHPLNPKYQDIELDHKKRYAIVGKVMEKIKKY